MNKDQDLFHLFIQYADKLPQQASIFPFFEFMDQSIRKSFNQLKKAMKKDKELNAFQEFWNELTNQDRVKLYCNWVILLKKALELEKNITIKIQPQSMTIQDQIYIRKVNIFNKLEKKIAKLTPTHLHIIGKNDHEYQLKSYQIRKSRSKNSFSWVLKPIYNNFKTLYCEVSSQNMFDEWYYALSVNINNQRVEHFLNCIKHERLNPIQKNGQTKIEDEKQGKDKDKKKEKNEKNEKGKKSQKNDKKQEQTSTKQENILKQNKQKKGDTVQKKQEVAKTLTEIMIDKQMKTFDNDNLTQMSDPDEQFQSVEDENSQKDTGQGQQKGDNGQKQEKEEWNPNIFKRLAPEYPKLTSFADTPFNSVLIHCDNQYRIYELPHRGENEQIILKMFTIFPFPKSLVFQAISSDPKAWNDQIDVFTIKTNISSENSVLIYEKNKAYGLLYRERDFLYLRHSFSIYQLKQKNTFIIDKSIDSIHHPPFMSVVRGQKKLIWGLIQKQSQQECILVLEGWIKGGGYMNHEQNKDMTLKFMKKINNMRGYLKQLSFTQNKNIMFKEDWVVHFEEEDEKEEENAKEKNSKQAKLKRKKSREEEELDQFMKRTSQQQQADGIEEQKPEIKHSQEKPAVANYIPPPFDSERFVIIPKQYLKTVHILVPKEKPLKPQLAPHVRGHHLWKGQWQILPGGGLAYIDQQKMKEQKKILTYIIKRIGKNIFSGKGILNISLPVDIFCQESNIERLAMSFGFFPFYLEKAAAIKEPHIQIKYVIASGIASSLIYMTMDKPFNPILGETYQCWIDGCPIYFEQISHHPPIAAFMMKGRGYTVSGCVEAKMQLWINSGTGNNEGIFKVQFDNGNTFYYTTPAGCLSGLTYGERKLNMVGKSFYWTQQGLFLQITYNPSAKTKGFFGGGGKGEGDQKRIDYFEGHLKQYKPEILNQITFKTQQNRIIPIIPKNAPTEEASQTYYKVSGCWNKYVKIDSQILFDIDQNRYYSHKDEENPLPSHSNYREDVVYRRMKNFVVSQQFKQILEQQQRNDRKLRAKFGKSSSH